MTKRKHKLSETQVAKLQALDDVHFAMNNTAVLVACCQAASEMLVERYKLSEPDRLAFAQEMVDRAVKILGAVTNSAVSQEP